MKDRIKQIIDYKTKGRMGKFGELCGWSTQYTHNVVTEGKAGLQPIITILKVMPEINARWLLLGEGTMFDASYAHDALCRKAIQLAKYEKYICVMSEEEITSFVNDDDPISEELEADWEAKLQRKLKSVDDVFNKAYARVHDKYNMYNK